MMTRMSGTSGRWSMWLAVAFLMAMTSTLSAQQMVAKGDLAGASMSQSSAGSSTAAAFGFASRLAIQAPTPFIGTCGTDTTVHHDPQPAHVRAHLMAARLFAVMYTAPGHLALQLMAYRRWIQSTIDVLPSF